MGQLTGPDGKVSVPAGGELPAQGTGGLGTESPLRLMRSCDQRTLLPGLLLLALSLGTLGGWRQPERPSPPGAGATAPGYRPRIAVNSCDWPELCLLPGISEARARQLVRDRQLHGPFRRPEDLQRVAGIGPKTQARLERWLDFSCPAPEPGVGDMGRLRSLN
jgi:competence protein ComEA